MSTNAGIYICAPYRSCHEMRYINSDFIAAFLMMFLLLLYLKCNCSARSTTFTSELLSLAIYIAPWCYLCLLWTRMPVYPPLLDNNLGWFLLFCVMNWFWCKGLQSCRNINWLVIIYFINLSVIIQLMELMMNMRMNLGMVM